MWQTALLAGFGGTLPSLSRIATSFAAQPDQPWPHLGILVALGIFFLLGSVLNLAFNKDEDLSRALIIGISAPGIITNIIAGAANAPSGQKLNELTPPPALTSKPSSGASGMLFGTSAFAQPNPSSVNQSDAQSLDRLNFKEVIILFNFVGPYAYQGYTDLRLQITLSDKDGNNLLSSEIFPRQPPIILRVPQSATSLSISSPSSASGAVNFPPDAKSIAVRADIFVNTSGFGDFGWALGTRREGEVNGINLVAISSNSYPISHARILWVDDKNPTQNAFERSWLSGLGITFDLANTTNEALNKLAHGSYNLIISDFARKDESEAAYKLLSELKKSPPYPPVIIYSASANPKFEKAAIEKGAYGETNSTQILLRLIITALFGNRFP
jgi:CheY-like chemotaxis protein